MKAKSIERQRDRRHTAQSPEQLRRMRYGPPLACTVHGPPCKALVRGLCRSVYRKFREHGIALPPMVVNRKGLTAAQQRRRMREWVRTLTPERRALLAAALADEIMGTEAPTNGRAK